MKIIIQCASKKNIKAGFMKDSGGNKVLFVANPHILNNSSSDFIIAHPDDRESDGRVWRDVLVDYNKEYKNTGKNPSGLYPAYLLYSNKIYKQLINCYGIENVFILSAGWGLISSYFLTPKYDITLSPQADRINRRSERDLYNDFNMVSDDEDDDMIFFGGKSYLSLFQKLTKKYKGERFVFHNSSCSPELTNCKLIKYETKIRTNWHYECAKEFMRGKIAHR